MDLQRGGRGVFGGVVGWGGGAGPTPHKLTKTYAQTKVYPRALSERLFARPVHEATQPPQQPTNRLYIMCNILDEI